MNCESTDLENALALDLPEPYDMDAADELADEASELARQREIDDAKYLPERQLLRVELLATCLHTEQQLRAAQ
jgi:hypothetical protein